MQRPFWLYASLRPSLLSIDLQVLYDGRRVEFCRKAQALAGALMARFAAQDPRFAFADAPHLAADSGPAVAAVLRAKGVLKLSEELGGIIDGGQELPSGPHERALRAAAVAAADAVVQAAGGAFTPFELGCYLGLLVEEGQELHGAVHTHLTKCRAY